MRVGCSYPIQSMAFAANTQHSPYSVVVSGLSTGICDIIFTKTAMKLAINAQHRT